MMAFEEIYSLYRPKVFRLCMGYVNDADLAKDLVQETFIRIWQNINSFREESAVSTWVFRIASNICLRQLDKEKKRNVTSFPPQLEDKTDAGQEDKINFLYACISQLGEVDRIIISMVLEDLPQSEIALIVGLTEVNVRVKIHRIKEKLTEKFQKNEQFQ